MILWQKELIKKQYIDNTAYSSSIFYFLLVNCDKI